MKNQTMFMAGLAGASFFPETVIGAQNDQSYLLLLGGVSAVLPNVIEAEWRRYYRHTEFRGAVHSLLAAVLWAGICQLFAGGLAAAVGGLGWGLHLLLDQRGWAGTSLLWPLLRRRIKGFGWKGHERFILWLALCCLLYNLNLHAEEQLFKTEWAVFFAQFFFVPVLLFISMKFLFTPRDSHVSSVEQMSREVREELAEERL